MNIDSSHDIDLKINEEMKLKMDQEKNKYRLIHSSKKVFYFSKFSLEYDQCLKILNFTKILKENVLKSAISEIKYFIKEHLEFTNTSITGKEKAMCLYSVLFIHYYSKNSYEVANSIDSLINEDLVNIFVTKGIKIKNLEEFKIFAYSFYMKLISEISKLNYKEIKIHLSKYSEVSMPKTNNMFQLVKDYVEIISNIDLKKAIKNCIVPLIATKEKIVDMVIDVTNNSSLQNKMGSSNSQNSDINSNVTINSKTTPNIVNETISKRLFGEVCQETITEKEFELTKNLAFKADTLVEVILNQSNHIVYNIRNFLCYIVDIQSDLIKLFSECEELPDEINLRVIIGARNLYLIALEVYYSIADLYDINLSTLMQIFKLRYQFSYNEDIDTPIRLFFKVLINNLLEYNANFTSEEILKESLNMINKEWEEEINKNSKDLTYYCKC